MKLVALVFSMFLSSHAFAHFNGPNPWMGQQRALVLLLQWSDQPTQHLPSEVEDVFFKPQSPSLHQFFLENSAGKFDLTGSVSEWRTSSIQWNSLSADQQCDPNNIVKAAWDQFGRDVDISKYDSNHDGRIDHLFIVHSGRIQFNRVGPDCMFGSFPKAEHVAVFQVEGTGPEGKSIPIGFYAHESGHQFYDF